jgi:rubrerythrin
MSVSAAPPPSETQFELLDAARLAEKEQALLYRSLAAAAEETVPELAHRFHDLHADEQHHLSRLTARVLELGGHPADLSNVSVAAPDLGNWAELVREREQGEIRRYQALLQADFDSATKTLLAEILEVEEHHVLELGGKWMMA